MKPVRACWPPLRRLRRSAQALLLAAALPPAAQAASWYNSLYVGSGQWSAEAGLRYMNGAQTSTAASGESAASQTNAFGESLRIGNSGFYVLSPLFFTGGLSVDLQLNQDRGSGSGGEAGSQGRAVGYAFDGTFLAEKPYPVTVAAQRSQTRTLQSYGGLSLGTNTNRSVVFSMHQDGIFNDWGYPWTEGKFELTQEHNQNTTTSFGQSLVTDERSKTFNFDASKGFETADLHFIYQLMDRENLEFSQGTFQSRAGRIDYSVDFGPTFNRRFDASLSYLARNGQSSAESWTNSETLHLDHSKKLSTDYSYDAAQFSSGDVTSLTQSVRAAVSHQLYKNLHTSASSNASQATLPGGTTSAWGANLGQGYNHSLPGKGTFMANWSAGYQLNSNQLDSPNVQVFDEVHSATAPLSARLGFLLNQTFVTTSTIRIFDVKNGGRIELFEVTDFDLLPEGNQTRVIPLATSLRVADGDPLLVSYVHQVDPRLESTTQSRAYGIGVDYRWINVAYGHQESDQTPSSQNTSVFLQSSRQDFVRVGLRGVIMNKAVNGDVTLEDNAGDNLANRQIKIKTGMGWNAQRDLRVTVDANLNHASHTLPNRHTTLTMSVQSALHWYDQSLVLGANINQSDYAEPDPYSDDTLAFRASYDWNGANGWMHSVTADWSRHSDSNKPVETLMQVSGKSSVTLGKLSLNLSAALGQSKRGGSSSLNRSLNASAVRRF